DAVQSYHNLTLLLLDRKRIDDASKELALAVKNCEELVSHSPKVPKYRKLLGTIAGTLVFLGTEVLQAGRQKDASVVYRRAIKVYDGLGSESTQVPEFKEHLERACTNLGVILMGAGEHKESLV